MFLCLTGKISAEGTFTTKVKKWNESEEHSLDLLVVNTAQDLQPLLGWLWLDVLYPDWRRMFSEIIVRKENELSDSINLQSVQGESNFVTELKLKFGDVFVKNANDFINDFEVEIVLKDVFLPIFHKAYVPYKLRTQVEDELERLRKHGILRPVRHSKQ